MPLELNNEPYHRLGAQRAWWKPIVELVLVVFFWLVFTAVAFAIVHRVAHVKKVKELSEGSHQVVTLINLAILTPAAVFACMVMNRDWRTLLSVYRRVRWGLLARCAGLAVAIALGQVALALVMHMVANGATAFSAPDWGPFLAFCGLMVALVPFQATAEEVAFRGVLQQFVGAYVRWIWVPITISAVAFMFAHGGLQPSSVSICAMGIAYAWLAIRTGGLESGIAHHIVNNVVAFISVAAHRGVEHTGVREVNGRVGWASVVFDIAQIALYVWLVTRMQRRLTERALAGADQIEQHAPERRGGVEHAEHGSHAEPLPPEQQ